MRITLFLILVLLSTSVFAVSERVQGLMQKAEQGEAWAQLNLGAAYDNGMDGLPQNPQKALEWYRKSAEQGVAEAQFNLAHCLATGRGTEMDYQESYVWMQKAAQQQIPEAQFLLGVMYHEGLGIKANAMQAKMWLQRAAKQGYPDAIELLKRL